LYLLDVKNQPGSLPVQQTAFDPVHELHDQHPDDGQIKQQ
jgi:hypothetical protein